MGISLMVMAQYVKSVNSFHHIRGEEINRRNYAICFLWMSGQLKAGFCLGVTP